MPSALQNVAALCSDLLKANSCGNVVQSTKFYSIRKSPYTASFGRSQLKLKPPCGTLMQVLAAENQQTCPLQLVATTCSLQH